MAQRVRPGCLDSCQPLRPPVAAAAAAPLAHTGRGGFTLLEVTAGMALMTIGLLGFCALLVSNERSHERAIAEAVVSTAFRDMAEDLRNVPFDEVCARYQNHSFPVEAIMGTGTVRIIVDETDTSPGAQILGLPRDLDGDGAATTTDVSSSYLLLPVTLEVSWPTLRGQETRELYLLLAHT